LPFLLVLRHKEETPTAFRLSFLEKRAHFDCNRDKTTKKSLFALQTTAIAYENTQENHQQVEKIA
jgi:hypothetical protein